MHKYLEKKEEVNFDKIFNQVLGNVYNTIIFLLLYKYKFLFSNNWLDSLMIIIVLFL